MEKKLFGTLNNSCSLYLTFWPLMEKNKKQLNQQVLL